MCVCTCVCVYVCVYVYNYVCVNVCINVYVCMYMYVSIWKENNPCGSFSSFQISGFSKNCYGLLSEYHHPSKIGLFIVELHV